MGLDFKSAMTEKGLVTKDVIVPDGKLHRFHVEGDKAGSKNGWYVFYGDGMAAGAFGCWKRQISKTWCTKPKQKMTSIEYVDFKRRMNAARIAREEDEQKRRAIARDRAMVIWQSSLPAPDYHPYLMKKAVGNHGLRLHKGALVVPLRDGDGILHSLQFIDGEGNKRFLCDGRKSGCYFAIGSLADSICVAEGYATASSIHEATGLPVAVAFDAGNLVPVARALRATYPRIQIILCADNDENTPGNPGLSKAREAATAVGAMLVIPPVVGDFNDFLTGEISR